MHSIVWGSKNKDSRGRMIEKIKNDYVLNKLNDGWHTHFHTQTGNFSSIDLTISEPQIIHNFRCELLESLYNSDHLPIVISISYNNSNLEYQNEYARCKIQDENWEHSKNLTNTANTELPENKNITEIVETFAETITHMPIINSVITKFKKGKKTASWWSKKCELAKKKPRNAAGKQKSRKI